MKTTTITNELLMVAPVLIAILYVSTIWQQLPIQIPVHYNIAGNVDGWASKNTIALIGIGMTAALYLLLRYLPELDTRGRLQSANYQKIRFIVMLITPALQVGIFYMAAHQASSKSLLGLELAIVSLLIAGIGNYITTLKPNWFVGIRTPWTLDSESVWRKTHQLGGRVLFAGGLLAALLALIVPSPYTVGVVVGILVIVAIIPVVYSYIYFRQEKAHPSL